MHGLPEVRHQTKAGVEAIFGIAGQFLAQNFFFVEETKDDQRNEENEGRQG